MLTSANVSPPQCTWLWEQSVSVPWRIEETVKTAVCLIACKQMRRLTEADNLLNVCLYTLKMCTLCFNFQKKIETIKIKQGFSYNTWRSHTLETIQSNVLLTVKTDKAAKCNVAGVRLHSVVARARMSCETWSHFALLQSDVQCTKICLKFKKS